MPMRYVRTYVALWASVTLVALFLVGHYFTGERGPDNARIVISSLGLGMNLALCLTWFRRAWEAIKTGIRTGTGNIFVGVWLSSFINLTYFLWLIMVITMGPPGWTRELPVGGIFACGYFLAATSLWLTPLNTKEPLEPISVRWLIVAGAIGGIAAGIAMTLAFMGLIHLDL